ncbi:tetratricopeptide repeat protein [Solidesulfovibrio fructosivorans]|uniref:tetratricopeptide repeat protein n=1 Tax=Solidesulfovibrio fructosivorans TaxID=878 RepID=UPI001F288EB3|nr:tetratricopeptide repeat protein [Solidesulfovibrio fructosivorans]
MKALVTKFRPVRLVRLLLVLLVIAPCWFVAAATDALATDAAQAAVREPQPPQADPLPPVAPGEETDAAHGFRVELVKSAPSAGTMRVGGAASFAARIFDGERELDRGDYVCRWRSDTEARFLETEGPFTNTAVFLRPGRQRVWVEVVPRSGPSEGLAAVSVPVELDVAQPAFSLGVRPSSPLVGEETTVVIRDFPVHDGVEFRWDPLPASAKLVRVGERSLTFYPTAAGEVPVHVSATAGAGAGDTADLGAATVRVRAREYAVAVADKGLTGPPATVWREGEGPVAASGVAVRQNVRLLARISPSPHNPPLAYAWSLCPGARARGGTDGREIEASRDAVGPCKASVEIRDARGLLLGRGEGGFTVAVSQEELDAAVANARETDRLTRAAADAWDAGDAAGALEAAGRAVRKNPRDAPALTAYDRISRDKARLDDTLAKADAALGMDDFGEVAAMLGEAAKICPRAEAIGAMRQAAVARRETLDRVARLLAAARDKWDAGAVDGALKLTGQALSLDPNHAAAKAERERMVADRDRLIAALKQSTSYLAAKRFDSAGEALAEARAICPRFPAIAELTRAIAARKDKAWRMDERLARARDQWNAGDADGALATLTEAARLDPEHAGAAATKRKLAQAREHLGAAEDRAEAALDAGKIDAAKAALSAASGINPRHERLKQLQAALAHRVDRDRRVAGLAAEAERRNAAGDTDGAILALNDLIALVPDNAKATATRDALVRARDAANEALSRAKDALASGRYDLALGAVAEAEKANPKLPALAGWRDKIQAARKRAEAVAASRLATAEKLFAQKDIPGADAALRAAREAGPLPSALAGKARDLSRRIEAGLARQAAARREQANRVRTTAQTADADRRARCAAIGRQAAAKRSGGDHAGAIRDYQSLLNLCPDTCQAYNNVGASLFSLGYAAESLPWFDEAVKCAPDERLYRDNAALTQKRLAQSRQPDPEKAATCKAAFETAESRRVGGDLSGAMEGYRRVVATCPDFCAAYNNMGLALHKLGRTAQALPLFERALRCNPKENLFKDNYELTAKRLRTAERRP